MNIQKTGENELESNCLQTAGQTRILLIVVSWVLFAGLQVPGSELEVDYRNTPLLLIESTVAFY